MDENYLFLGHGLKPKSLIQGHISWVASFEKTTHAVLIGLANDVVQDGRAETIALPGWLDPYEFQVVVGRLGMLFVDAT
jgi:hypothetical protein